MFILYEIGKFAISYTFAVYDFLIDGFVKLSHSSLSNKRASGMSNRLLLVLWIIQQ